MKPSAPSDVRLVVTKCSAGSREPPFAHSISPVTCAGGMETVSDAKFSCLERATVNSSGSSLLPLSRVVATRMSTLSVDAGMLDTGMSTSLPGR